MTASPTGTVERSGDRVDLVLSRTLPTTGAELWRWVSESDLLARWFGPFAGDPATGRVELTMSVEDGAPTFPVDILECRGPQVLRVRTREGAPLELALAIVDDAATTLTAPADAASPVATLSFAQVGVGVEDLGAMGAGWEYYLDRLVAAFEGRDADSVDFADYHPAMAEHFTQQLD